MHENRQLKKLDSYLLSYGLLIDVEMYPFPLWRQFFFQKKDYNISNAASWKGEFRLKILLKRLQIELGPKKY